METSQIEKLPTPTGWRILVLPHRRDEKTKGGIILTEQTLEQSQVASSLGLVLKIGPDAYKDKERFPQGAWCKEKDWVIFGKYAGSRIPIEGGEVRLMNDDEILGVVKDPKDFINM